MFLSFDGGEGSGKSTQIALTCKWLRELGCNVVACRDPGSTKLGDAVRDILLHRQDLPIIRRSEMLLYMAARSQLVEEIIEPALAQGIIIVSDRYLLANIVYQGYAGGLDIAAIAEIGHIATNGIMPDLTLYLDVPLNIANARINRPLDRMERMGTEFHTRVREGFLTEAAKPQSRIMVIDATGTIVEIQNEIRRIIQDFFTRSLGCEILKKPRFQPDKSVRMD